MTAVGAVVYAVIIFILAIVSDDLHGVRRDVWFSEKAPNFNVESFLSSSISALPPVDMSDAVNDFSAPQNSLLDDYDQHLSTYLQVQPFKQFSVHM